jgi:hypothetical protein
VWYVEQIAHAALSINVSMSAGSTELTMSISEQNRTEQNNLEN